MKKSNIFAFIELSKLVAEISKAENPAQLKQKFKSQSAYFNILESRYFSDGLVPEWEAILKLIQKKEALVDESGRVIMNATANSLDHFTDQECKNLANKISALFQKVEKEFK
ncbi:hypothetical protein [Dyadobacter tibetensis]|uniref:hypothetical protein n=1 Tax=Dyadobacter tibetensis TaxID=1211851 RepID=UPI0004700E44|nr:hypothetical protein [Dyadobacter tibetensis]